MERENFYEAAVAICIIKIDFKMRHSKGQKGNFIVLKGSIQQGDILLIDIYSSNVATYIKHILIDIKGETDSNTVIVGNFNTLGSMDR